MTANHAFKYIPTKLKCLALASILLTSTIQLSALAQNKSLPRDGKVLSPLERGINLYKSKNYKDAIAQFENQLKTGSNKDRSHLYLGLCYYNCANPKKAISHYQWLIENSQNSKIVNQAKKSKLSIKSKSAWKSCPQRCLKLSTPGWKNKIVRGKPSYLVWMDFKHKNGAIEFWSQDHLGELIIYKNGDPKNLGLCPTCKGRLYIGNPVKFIKAKKNFPKHPLTLSSANKMVFGKPWSKTLINQNPGSLYYWLNNNLLEKGWVIVDKGRVANAYLMVVTNGTKSNWLKVSPTKGGRSELIMMARRTR